MGAVNSAVLLPHTRLYGGVKRFFELGAALSRMSHSLTVYTPDGVKPQWGGYDVVVRPLRDLTDAEPDILFFTESRFLDAALESRAKYKVFYHVRPSDRIRKIVKHRDIHLFACSTNIYRSDRLWYRVRPFPALGGSTVTCILPSRFSRGRRTSRLSSWPTAG
jgi:hypothetical protein